MESALATSSTSSQCINWLKKSAKRWTIVIIHHLMMMRWVLGQFRNKVKHTPNGPEAMVKYNYLNYQINIELTTGPNSI